MVLFVYIYYAIENLSEESGEVAQKSLSHSSSVDVAFSQRGQAIVLTPSRAAFDTFQNGSVCKKIRQEKRICRLVSEVWKI